MMECATGMTISRSTSMVSVVLSKKMVAGALDIDAPNAIEG